MTNKVKWQRKMPKCQLQNDTPTNFKRRQQWQSKNANCKMTMKNAAKWQWKMQIAKWQWKMPIAKWQWKMPIAKWHAYKF